jgi:3',5'-cyclic AMP phosphodiesterase CpdA
MDVNRRGFMQCMAWAGTGVLWTMTGGVLSSCSLANQGAAGSGTFSFAQISDTHVGFNGPANKDAMGTLTESIARINAQSAPPAFVLHTGDLSHGQKPGAFDTLNESLKAIKTERIFFIPGEHDVAIDGGKEYLARYGADTVGQRGWRSFDYKGVHFVGLVNVLQYKADGLGALGTEQLEWLEKDLAPLGSSTPIVVYSHVPLWAVYPKWGWTTGDATQAFGYLKKFGSVTALNGHIHQVIQKVEGNITFHSAMSTAFPQPAPGAAPSPGPMKVADDQLRKVLGVREVRHAAGSETLAVVNTPLA